MRTLIICALLTGCATGPVNSPWITWEGNRNINDLRPVVNYHEQWKGKYWQVRGKLECGA